MPGMAHMGNSASGWDIAGAIGLLLWAAGMWAAVGVLAYANRGRVRPWVYRGAIGVILIGVVGQIGHFQEHVAQAAYWVGHPNAKPWMTPWGMGLSNGFGQIDTAKPSLGMEILHLVGNFIFLAGLAGIVVLTRRVRQTKTHKWGRMGVWMQGIHGLEHLALTLSIAFGASRAIGLSTWFGILPNGPGLWTYRIWWHAIANLIGTTIFAMALFHLWRERATIRADYEPQPSPAIRPVRTPAASAGRATALD